jgi:plasmid maintenance system antidote protein VapI
MPEAMAAIVKRRAPHAAPTPHYWLSLQSIYDLKRARAEMPAEALQIEAYATA